LLRHGDDAHLQQQRLHHAVRSAPRGADPVKTDGFVIGKITEVVDPENLGRVKVRYPHMGDTLTEWSSVASIMAGTGRGCFFMPEIDDEVLVAPQQGDWNHPFIIGF